MKKEPKQRNKFMSAPDDQVRDPRYAVPVSRFGKDRGAKVQDTYMSDIRSPDNENARIQVFRVRSGLGRMLKEGSISKKMFKVGAHFQRHFEIAGYCAYTTVLLDQAFGNGGGIEHHLDKTMQSRLIVNNSLKLLQWPYTQTSKAAWWIIGHGMGLEEITARKDLHDLKGASDRRYWKAMVVAALQVMEVNYAQSQKGKPFSRTNGM